VPVKLGQRLGWDEWLRPFLYKELPDGTGWTATLGSVCVLVFAVMAMSGAFLVLYYNPSPDKAYQSVDYITNHVAMGAVLRGIHHWGASVMVVLVGLHLLVNFFSGSYKAPRELTWMAGVCLFLVTLALGFTGYLLPWDMKAYWATVVGTNLPKSFPLIGRCVAALALGGDSVSGLTLTRFYAIHMVFLPALMAACTAIHIYLVRIHGLAEAAESLPVRTTDSGGLVPRQYRFYPEHVFRIALVFAAVFALILGMAAFCTIPRDPVAGSLIAFYSPHPEWYFLWIFQLLTYFAGRWETVGTLVLPIMAVVLLFALPMYDTNPSRGWARRPIAVGFGMSAVVAVVYLSCMGMERTRPYGQVIPVPARQLTASERRDAVLFSRLDCNYCHQIDGRGGHRAGPDLANLVAKGRSESYLTSYIKNPQAVVRSSIMPKYNLPQTDLSALAQFARALDFGKYPVRWVGREELKTN
jgi:quinol-cytochrome oxidoreductase complex cytochrome b subunit